MRTLQIDTHRRRDVDRFIQLPFRIYRGSELWVPPLRDDIRSTLNEKRNPFFQHSDAASFVVESGSETLGRITALENRNYNRHHERRDAFFYLFESVDDPQTATSLFSAAADWARGRGLQNLIGPKGFLQGDGKGMLVEGFEHRPALGAIYNHAYYPQLAKKAGLVKETDLLSGYIPGDYHLPKRFFDIADRVIERRNLRIKTFSSKRELRQWAQRIGELYNQAFSSLWDYCPLTPAETKALSDRMISITNPKLIKLVMKGEKIIGFLFGFVDVSAAIQRTGGRLWPLGWYHLLREFKRTKWVNFNGAGLLPEHQGVGANAVLYSEMAKTIAEFGFEHAEAVQIEERNIKSLSDMKAIGMEWYKRHRIYRLALT